MPQRVVLPIVVMMMLLASTLSSYCGDEPTPHTIIDKALLAGGGAEKIAAFKAVSFKGESKAKDGTKVKFSGLFAGPGLFRLDLDYGEGQAFMIGGGDTFWIKMGKAELKEIHRGNDKNSFDAMAYVFYGIALPDQLLSLKKKEFMLSVVGDQAVNGVQATAVRVKHELRPDALIFFDKSSGLPVKTQLKLSKDAIENILWKKSAEQIELFFDAYKEVDGVKHFTKLRLRAADETVEFELREVKLLKTFDDGLFKKPS